MDAESGLSQTCPIWSCVQISNYAFKPIAELALGSNQTIVPQRLNAALGVIRGWLMYRGLKSAIWEALDAELASHFRLLPDKARLNRRYYALGEGRCVAYLVLEYSDVAGGAFNFLGALSRQAKPDVKAIYYKELSCPSSSGIFLVSAQSLISDFPKIRVELSWQTPPRELILEALELAAAKEFLVGLGVTENERHHLLNLEILETLGIAVSRNHYWPVVERTLPQIRSVVTSHASSLINLLKERAEECNRLSQ